VLGGRKTHMYRTQGREWRGGYIKCNERRIKSNKTVRVTKIDIQPYLNE